MPRVNLAARQEYERERRERIADNPSLLAKKRKQGREMQARVRADPAKYAVALERNADWRYRNPNYRAEWSLKKKYGLTLAEYSAMWDRQDGVCAICKRPESAIDPRTGRPRNLAVDHCHEYGTIRGLLCYRCNSALGKLGDDLATVRAACAYLEAYAPR